MKAKMGWPRKLLLWTGSLPTWWLTAAGGLTFLIGWDLLDRPARWGMEGPGILAGGGGASLLAWGVLILGLILLVLGLLLALWPKPAWYYFGLVKQRCTAREWPLDPDTISNVLAGYATLNRRLLFPRDHVVLDVGKVECILVLAADAQRFFPCFAEERPEQEAAVKQMRYYFFTPATAGKRPFPLFSDILHLGFWSDEGFLYEVRDLEVFALYLLRRRQRSGGISPS